MKRKSFRFLAAMLALVLVVAGTPMTSPVAVAAVDINEFESVVFNKVSASVDYALVASSLKGANDAYKLSDYVTAFEEEEVKEIQIGEKTYGLAAESDGVDSYKVTITKKSDPFPKTLYAFVLPNPNTIQSWTLTNMSTPTAELDTSGRLRLKLSEATNKSVEVTPVTPTPTYTMTLPANTDAFSVSADQKTVEENGTFTFSVNVYNTAMKPVVTKQGSDSKREEVPVLSGPDNHETYETYQYSIDNVNDDYEFFVSLKNKTYTVSVTGFDSTSMVSDLDFAGNSYYTGSVNQGGSFSFMLSPKDSSYETPTVTYSIDGTDKTDVTITPIGGTTYNINNVTGTLTIKITAGAKKQYTVSYPKSGGVGYSVTANDQDGKITHGTDFEFKVTVDKEYSNSVPVITTSAAYTLKGPDDGSDGKKVYTYTFANVQSDISISVSGLTLNTYHVTLPTNAAGYTVNGNGNIAYAGRDYVFTLELADGYKYTGEANNIVTLKEADGAKVSVEETQTGKIYTVTLRDFTKNVTVQLSSDIAPQTFTVKEPTDGKDKEYTFEFSSGNGTGIAYGADVSFTVTPKPGYRVASVSYKASDGSPKLAQSIGSNQYSITGVTADYTIEVKCDPIQITVKYTKNAVNAFGLSFSAETITKEYDVKNTPDNFNTSDGQLKLKDLLKPDRAGFTTTGWVMNGELISGDIEIKGTNDQTIELTCSYTLVNPGESDGGKTGPITATSSSSSDSVGPDKRKETWECQVKIDENMSQSDQSVIQNAIKSGDFKIKSYGMLYSKSTIANPANYIDEIKKLSESKFLNDSSVYSYYHSNADERLKYGGTYTEKITVANNAGNRYGVIWFVITVGGTDYVVFGEPQTIS